MKTKKIQRISFALACAILMLSSCSGGKDWAFFRGRSGSGNTSSSIRAPVGLRWKILLQKHTGEERFFNQPVVSGNTIFFGSSDGNLYALDLESGFMNWTVRTGGPVNSVPCMDAKNVYFGSSDGNVYAVDKLTGKIVWTFGTRGAVNSTLVMWRGMIVAAADTDAVYVITPEGKPYYHISNEYWYHNSFQIYRDRIVFAPGSPETPLNLAIFDLARDRYLWTLNPGLENYPWFSFPAIGGPGGGRLYYSASGLEGYGGNGSGAKLGYKFFCLDFETGKTLWKIDSLSYFPEDPGVSQIELFGEGILLLDYAAPLLWRNRVIYSCGDALLRCYDAGTGREVWSRSYPRPMSSAVSAAGDRLYFGLRSKNGEGRLVCVSASSGKELWTVPVEGSILNSPVIAGKRIFFGTDAGCFYVFEDVL